MDSNKLKSMGVRMLNRYLREYSSNAMREIRLNELSDKKIAIDISIFMYQFKGNGKLLESMYKMIMLFRRYRVIPVFVFDGTPPDEKLDILNERDATKKEAKEICDQLEEKLASLDNDNDAERENLEKRLFNERKKCLRITNANIREVKALIEVLGVNYVLADGEADDLCFHMVKKRIVWACMTEDMDMFVYGCPRVLRNFNLEEGSMTLYSMGDILGSLKMTQTEFRDVCLLAGTDYNKGRFTIYTSMSMFYKYLKKRRNNVGFYDWLIYTKVINHDEKDRLSNSRSMFMKDKYNTVYKFTNKRILKEEVSSYMEKYKINYLINV